MLTSTLLSLTLWVQQILIVLVIIPKHKMRLMERTLTIMARVVLVTTAKMIIIERILVALEYKESDNRYYRLY